jgi:hypothetical protein
VNVVGTSPAWSAVDEATESLLALVADDGHVSADYEWAVYVNALENCAAVDGLIFPNMLRRHVRGSVAPRRIGAFANRALSQGLVEYTGEWEISDDTEGRNGGKPARIMRWLGGAA